jgi:Permeases of the major facilitator superfamily
VPAAAHLPGWVWVLFLVVTLALAALTVNAFRADTRAQRPPSAAARGFLLGAGIALLAFVLTAPLDPGSIASYTTTLATIVSAVILMVVGAIADRSERPARLLGLFAWGGSLAACLLFFLVGTNWRFGAAMMILATICLGASLVVYDAILIRIATPDDRDKVSSRGWALGYLGGGLLLAINLVIVSKPDLIGVDKGMAVRISMLSAGLWWALFTLIPVLGLWKLRGTAVTAAGEVRPPDAPRAGAIGGSIVQLQHTFRDLKKYPQTLMFLLAYLFFNDGIQTVIASSSIYGAEQLKFAQEQLIALILLVQFVAFGGALFFGWLAGRFGAVAHHPVEPGGVERHRHRGLLRAGEGLHAVRGPRRPHRDRARRLAGPLPQPVQPARAPGAGGRVLRLLPGDGARHVLVRDVRLRPGPPAHAQLPTGHRGPHHLLRPWLVLPPQGRRASGHHRRRQRDAGHRVSHG